MKALELFSQTSGRQTLGQGAVSLWQPCTEQYISLVDRCYYCKQHYKQQVPGQWRLSGWKPLDQAQRTRHSVPAALDDRVCSAGASRPPPCKSPSPPANPGCAGCVLIYVRNACIPELGQAQARRQAQLPAHICSVPARLTTKTCSRPPREPGRRRAGSRLLRGSGSGPGSARDP